MTTETKFRREFSERELLEFVLPTKQNAYDMQRVLKDLVFEVEKMYELLDRAVEMAEWYDTKEFNSTHETDHQLQFPAEQFLRSLK